MSLFKFSHAQRILKKNSLSLGLIAQIADTKKSDLTLNRIAESTGFKPITETSPDFRKKEFQLNLEEKEDFFMFSDLVQKQQVNKQLLYP